MTPAGWDHAASTVLASLAESAIRACVLASAVGAGLIVLRVRAAAVRLCAWTVVLVAAIGLAVLGRAVPALAVPVPVFDVFASADRAVHVTPPASASSMLTAASGVSRTAAPTSFWFAAVAVLYPSGVVWCLLRVCAGWLVTKRLERTARPIRAPATLAQLARHAAASGLARAPRLVESVRVFVPMTTSALKPVIVLPADWRTWSRAKLDAVLLHELAHVRRRDALTQRLSLIYRAVFWFSPLSWWLHHQLSELAEQASDEAALDAGIDRATYAETLVSFFSERPIAAQRADWHVAMARGGDASAERRVEHVLAFAGGPHARMTRVALAVVLSVSPIVALAAAVRPEPLAVGTLDLPDAPVAPRSSFLLASLQPSRLSPADAAPALTRASVSVVRPPVFAPATVAAPVAPDRAGVLTPVPSASVPPESPATAPALVNVPAPAPAVPPAPIPAPEPSVPAPVRPSASSDTVADLQDPTLVRRVEAAYTTEAMRAKIQGVVWLDVVVRADGTVGDVKVVKSLDPIFGLDDRAIAAAKAWLFQPGTRPDPVSLRRLPVSTVARLELEFRLH